MGLAKKCRPYTVRRRSQEYGHISHADTLIDRSLDILSGFEVLKSMLIEAGTKFLIRERHIPLITMHTTIQLLHCRINVQCDIAIGRFQWAAPKTYPE